MHIQTFFYILLPAITSGLDLARVSEAAAEERRIKNAPPPEPLNIKQRNSFTFGLLPVVISTSGLDKCETVFEDESFLV